AGYVIWVSDGIEHDVGAAPFGKLLDARRDIIRRGVDHGNRRASVSGIRLGLAHHADDTRAAPSRDLGGGLPDFAVDAHDEHGLAAFRHARAAETFDGGHEWDADAGRFHRARHWLAFRRVRRPRSPDAWRVCRHAECRDRRTSTRFQKFAHHHNQVVDL